MLWGWGRGWLEYYVESSGCLLGLWKLFGDGIAHSRSRHPPLTNHLTDHPTLRDPQDGPSAGVAMTVALVSLVTGRRVKPTVAMTGKGAGWGWWGSAVGGRGEGRSIEGR